MFGRLGWMLMGSLESEGAERVSEDAPGGRSRIAIGVNASLV